MTDKQIDEQEAEIDELRRQLLDLIADQKQAARVELERLLADYHAAAEANGEWYWTDQVEDRISALKFFFPVRR